jgi:two-component system LytT family response regulator
MRILIVDDTRLARQELKTLLAAHADADVVGEADDVDAAVAAIDVMRPDLVLLDIQLPGGSGFDVLARVDAPPPIVFTTAYDHYAVRAFEANALDYLVKPVAPQRLADALDKVRARLAAAHAPRGMLGADDQVFLRDGERCWFVALAEIQRIVVDGNYATVWFRGQKAMLPRSLAALEARLDPALFFRANRNTLVNLHAVRAVEPWINDGYRLRLEDGSEVDVSRRQAKELREKLAL